MYEDGKTVRQNFKTQVFFGETSTVAYFLAVDKKLKINEL